MAGKRAVIRIKSKKSCQKKICGGIGLNLGRAGAAAGPGAPGGETVLGQRFEPHEGVPSIAQEARRQHIVEHHLPDQAQPFTVGSLS